jgi:ATPase subunit of ABC transporter with duplicated ATPase domains
MPKLNTDKKQGARKLVKIQNSTLKIHDLVLINNLNFETNYGNRCSIVGKNGSGKSTLINSIINNNTTGNIIPAHNFTLYETKIAFLNQRYHLIDKSKTVLENLTSYSQNLNELEARHQLTNFKFFTSAEVNKKAELLSGGELVRLALAMITATEIDLLILDEPTNNVDITTLNQITQALREFDGAILIISHDIQFLKDLEVEKIFLLKYKTLTVESLEMLDEI